MKRLALFSFSILCLTLAVAVGFHIGSETAQAQAPGAIVGSHDGPEHFVMLDNGDVYYRLTNWTPAGIPYYDDNGDATYQLSYVGNFWGDGPVPVSPQSLGEIKGKYK